MFSIFFILNNQGISDNYRERTHWQARWSGVCPLLSVHPVEHAPCKDRIQVYLCVLLRCGERQYECDATQRGTLCCIVNRPLPICTCTVSLSSHNWRSTYRCSMSRSGWKAWPPENTICSIHGLINLSVCLLAQHHRSRHHSEMGENKIYSPTSRMKWSSLKLISGSSRTSLYLYEILHQL